MSTELRQVWTIHHGDISGPAAGRKLEGCHIRSDGTTFHFTAPDIDHVLSSTASSLTPMVPFTFPIFAYNGSLWAITVWTLPLAVDATGSNATGSNAIGSWSTSVGEGPNTAPQNGDFTAQTGGEIYMEKATSHARA